MKIGNKVRNSKLTSTKPGQNQSKKNMLIILVGVLTAVLIFWVYALGKKAEDTVSVVMLKNAIYKNDTIDESDLMEYKMLKGEFEKYAIANSKTNAKTRRIILWEERDVILGSFAAYPLQAETVAMWRDFLTSRVDNSDSVLYSFPGKNIVSLEIADDALTDFKTFLQPGDRMNITAIYKVEEKVAVTDENGEITEETVETLKEETVFKDIVVADLLNSKGDSVLDIYAMYNDATVYQQASMDADEAFQESVQPSSMIVAFTPEEESLYYEYLSRDSIEFKLSLPQRSK